MILNQVKKKRSKIIIFIVKFEHYHVSFFIILNYINKNLMKLAKTKQVHFFNFNYILYFYLFIYLFIFWWGQNRFRIKKSRIWGIGSYIGSFRKGKRVILGAKRNNAGGIARCVNAAHIVSTPPLFLSLLFFVSL